MRTIALWLAYLAQVVGWLTVAAAAVVLAALWHGPQPYIGSERNTVIVDLASDGHLSGSRRYTELYCIYLTRHGIKTRRFISPPDQPLTDDCVWYEHDPNVPSS
jgi:hypothetical protein